VGTPVDKNGMYGGTADLKKVNSKFQFINEKNEIIKKC
jgi:hypothetical protein